MRYKNIVLTGVMGCGKTTIGKMLARELQMGFLDLDQYIESKWGSISSLFERGEDYFREIESLAAVEVGEKEGYVIATGGGIIIREKNITALKKKGLIFFIDRPLEDILSDINISERPLLKDGKDKLIQLFEQRYPLYQSTCDIHIRKARQMESVIAAIIECWNERLSKK